MVPVVCIAGKSGAGKTTLIEKLVRELSRRGYKTGVMKHTGHSVPLDTPGKDTHKFAAAGATATALVTKKGVALFVPRPAEMDPEALAGEFFTGMDIVIAEGFKASGLPKIEVLGAGETGPDDSISGKIAVAGGRGGEKSGLPHFSRNEIKKIADFIEEKFLTAGSRSDVRLWVDGEYIHLKPFVKAFVGQTIKGMLNSLKGCKKPEKIRIKIGR